MFEIRFYIGSIVINSSSSWFTFKVKGEGHKSLNFWFDGEDFKQPP